MSKMPLNKFWYTDDVEALHCAFGNQNESRILNCLSTGTVDLCVAYQTLSESRSSTVRVEEWLRAFSPTHWQENQAK